MILECHRAPTGIGMPPFVVAMEEGRYTVFEDYALMMMMMMIVKASTLIRQTKV